MPCLTESLLVALDGGALGPDEASAARAHLESCADCRRRFDEHVSSLETAAPSGAPTARIGAPGPPEKPGALDKGELLGRYFILERLAAGGMGEVYAAYDPRLDRRVALKLLRGDVLEGMGAEEGRARLLREAQAMARLSHPNVITVHDVGELRDQVFVAMEYIDGRTARDWVGEKQRSWPEVLDVYLQAGRGVAAAHRAGLMHRDFKPHNVLIGKDGRVCVLDFGLARAAGAAELERPQEISEILVRSGPQVLDTELTQQGAVMGTPGYMSLEQIVGVPADPRTDQFSFCVSLYEGLYRERPFKGRSLWALAKEIEQGLPSSPRSDSDVPTWLYAVLRKGMAARPEDRFPSMEALLAALSADPSRARRRKLWIAGGAASALLLAGAAVALWPSAEPPCSGNEERLAGVWDARRREDVRNALLASGAPYAQDAWAGVDRALTAWTTAWATMRKEACEATHVRHEQPEELLYLRMLCLERHLDQARALTGVLSKANPEIVAHAVKASEALPPIARCADDVALTATPPPPDEATAARVDAIRGRLNEARALFEAGQYGPAGELAGPLSLEARSAGYRPIEAEVLALLASIQERVGDVKASEQSAHAAAWAAQAAGQTELVVLAWSRLVSIVGANDSRHEEGERWAHYATSAAEALPEDAPARFELERALASFLTDSGRYEEALRHSERALALAERAHGPDSPKVASACEDVASTLSWLGRQPEALVVAQRALLIVEAQLGRDHPDVANVLQQLAGIEEELDHSEAARTHYERALSVRERIFGPDNLNVAYAANNLALVYTRLGRHKDADRLLERAYATVRTLLGRDHPKVAIVLHSLADSKLAQGKHDEALALHTEAAELFRKKIGEEHPHLAYMLTGIGEAQLELGRPERAIEPLERALALREKSKVLPIERGRTRAALAQALWNRDRARAKRQLELAREELEAAGGKAIAELAKLERWAAAHGL